MEEEQQRTEKQKQINVIGLMKVPDQFRKMFQQLRRLAGERLQIHQFQGAVEYDGCTLASIKLGKNLLTTLSPFTRPCLYASLAAAYQGAWKIQKCNKFCEKAEEELLKLISQENKEQYLKISKFLVTLKFQHCAILSQLNFHQRALETCKSTLPLLQQSVSIIFGFSKKQEESFNSKCNDEGVMFSRKVYGFAGQILSTLSQQLADNVEPKQSKSSIFYFWERNPQKNEDQLKKIFCPQNNNNSRRSILGVNKQNHWVDQFNIGSIMRMGQMKPQTFDKNIPMEQYLFKDKIYQIVIHCSLAFFTIATEMRFMDSQKNGELQEMKSQKQLSKLQTIKKKYGYEQKSQTFKLSEAYHLRAIQIISSNIQSPIPYLSHMIKSYDKHYVFKKKLQQIAAIIDQSALQSSSIVNPNKNQSKINPNNIEYVSRAYGDQLTAINRQTTEEDQLQHYNDYLDTNNDIKKKNSQQQQQSIKLQQKNARNTAKLFLSQPHQDVKDRAKSVGRLRKNILKHSGKQDKTEKHLATTTQPTKAKKKKQRQVCKQKQQKIKKTRIKLTEYQGQGQLHVRTKSSTHIKFVFKKKK